jgi:hypothetical protein
MPARYKTVDPKWAICYNCSIVNKKGVYMLDAKISDVVFTIFFVLCGIMIGLDIANIVDKVCN